MAPEAYRNRQDVGPHSDIFALAVTLYYLVSRRMPFHADDDYGWIFAVAGNMEEQAQRLSDVCPDVSAGFSDIIAKGLQKKIPQRYGNAAEMKRDLEEHRKSRAQDLLQEVEKRREELERKQADHSEAVREHQQHMADEEQRIAKEQDELARRAQSRQAQLQRDQEELERKERELAGQGELNRDEQKKVHDERQRLEAERTKISEEKRRWEIDLQKEQQKLDQRKSEEEAQLKSENKKIEDRRRELEKKERQASKGLQVPPYWKNKSGINFVATKFVRDELQKFMVESACCSATKKTRVESVERVENESLWQMYQLRREILKKTCAAQSIRSLTPDTNWQPAIPSKADLSTDINEFYLFHGTSSKSARFICEHGFDERVAALDGLYGAGSYFAVNSCKSHQYSDRLKDSPTWVMLVCRVVMGSPYCTSTLHNGQRRPPDNAATPGRPFDSIFAQHGIANGGQQHHNEYVVFDRHQVYPEYIVRYTV